MVSGFMVYGTRSMVERMDFISYSPHLDFDIAELEQEAQSL